MLAYLTMRDLNMHPGIVRDSCSFESSPRFSPDLGRNILQGQADEEPSSEDLAEEERTARTKQEKPPVGEVEPAPGGGNPRQAYGAINIYLREIGRVKLLKPQEEAALAARIQAGDTAAREEMIKANLRLVVKIARDYEGLGVPLLDLISEGNIGLMKAVERFDPAKGAKLSTYASWWIKQSIKRALANQSKVIRLPVHMADKVSKMRRTSLEMQEELGREPTNEELAAEMGLTVRRLRVLRRAAVPVASLDASIGDDEMSRLGDLVKDENASTPYEQLREKTLSSMLREMVKTLSRREAAVLSARFGLDGNPRKGLDEIGQEIRVSRERVRQIQNKGLAKLRAQFQKAEEVHG